MASRRVAALKRALKALAKCLLGDYAIYRVGRVRPARTLPVPSGLCLRVLERQDLEAATDQELHDSAWYLGSEATAFGCYEGDRLIALACCWWGDRYRRRSSWPIGASAAKLVHVVTLPAARGRGLAPLLILHAEDALRREGRTPLYARIWHNNTPSLRAFEHAGWEPIGTLIEMNPLRLSQPWRFRLPAF
jgi:GNAT superfamily N-acetyltransferase